MATILLRRGTAANLPALQNGEPGWVTDTRTLYIGDGTNNYPIGGASQTVATLTDLYALASVSVATQVTIAPGTYTMNANLTIPAYVSLYVPSGVTIITTGYTLTINGPCEIGDYQVFSGTGAVVFGRPSRLNPLWWGAVGDDSTDCTSAIAAFISCLEASDGASGHIPFGIYRHTGISVSKAIKLTGDGGLASASGLTDVGGTVLKNTHATNDAITVTGTLLTGLVLEDFSVIGSTGTGNGITINAEGHMTLSRLSIRDNGGNGINLASSAHTDGINIDGCYIYSNGANGIYGRGDSTKQLNAINITGNHVYANAASGIDIWGTRINILNNVIQFNLGSGVKISTEDKAFASNAAYQVNIKNNYFEGDAIGEILAEVSYSAGTRTHSIRRMVIEGNLIQLNSAQADPSVTALVTLKANPSYTVPYYGFIWCRILQNEYISDTLPKVDLSDDTTYTTTLFIEVADGSAMSTSYINVDSATNIIEDRIRSGAGKPTITPDFTGQRYLDTTRNRWWIAFAPGSTTYWRPMTPQYTYSTLDDSGTPSVSGGNLFVTSGTTAITAFDDGYTGQVITIWFNHSVTVTDGANLVLNGGGNMSAKADDTLTLLAVSSTKWVEQSRSVN